MRCTQSRELSLSRCARVAGDACSSALRIAPGLGARRVRSRCSSASQPLAERGCGCEMPQRRRRRRRHRAGHAGELPRFRASGRAYAELKSVMLINSPGGNVVASMEFGAKLRQLGMAAIVAGYGYDGIAGGADAGRMRFGLRLCADGRACAAWRRTQSRVALHRMSVDADRGADARPCSARSAAGSPTGGWSTSSPATRSRWASARRSCVQAESLDPDHIRSLSSGEMRRWRLATPKL